MNASWNKMKRRGIAMTEYLIILAIVAIAAIAIVGLFGKQIKSVFSRSTDAMGGKAQAVDASIGTAAKGQVLTDDVKSFSDKAVKK